MPCPYCGATLAEGVRLCTACGRLLAPRPAGTESPGLSSAPPGPPATLGARPGFQPGGPSYASDPYGPFFDVRSLPPERAAAYRQHRFHATFSVTLLILVHVLTLGLAAPFLLARKYAFFPAIKSDDFSTGKAIGFLLIPLFNLFWVFVVCRRIVDRLTFQTRLWGLEGAPSRGLATTVAFGWLLSAIPYVGLPFVIVLYVGAWPMYLAQIQSVCNRLALEAVSPEVGSDMRVLERAMRLRWFGWFVLAPGFLMAAELLVAIFVSPSGPRGDAIWALAMPLIFGAVGGTLHYLGRVGSRDVEDELARTVPWIVAAYVRIDKNAAWTVAWFTIPPALVLLAAGLQIYGSPVPSSSDADATALWGLSAALGLAGAYAIMRALQARRRITALGDAPPAPQHGGPSAW